MTVTHGGRMPEDFSDSDPALVEFVQTMTNYAATRTKCFDDFVVNAAVAGVRQFVILAAGLDTRAWRLDAAWLLGVRDRPTRGAEVQGSGAGTEGRPRGL